MFYKGQRRTVPSARYGGLVDIIEATGWTLAELFAQPWDLITEMTVRQQKRALADRKR